MKFLMILMSVVLAGQAFAQEEKGKKEIKLSETFTLKITKILRAGEGNPACPDELCFGQAGAKKVRSNLNCRVHRNGYNSYHYSEYIHYNSAGEQVAKFQFDDIYKCREFLEYVKTIAHGVGKYRPIIFKIDRETKRIQSIQYPPITPRDPWADNRDIIDTERNFDFDNGARHDGPVYQDQAVPSRSV